LTFSIWGLIYLLLVLFIIYSFVRAGDTQGDPPSFIDKIGPLFAISSVANMGWIFAWQYEVLPLSLVLMLLLLGTLIVLYRRLDIGRSSAPVREKYLVHLSFSIYLGWISVATIANVTALLVAYGWTRFGMSESFWAILLMGIAVLLALSFSLLRSDIFYALVVDWALLGIFLKRSASAGNESHAVAVGAIVGLVVVSLAVLVQLARRKVYSA
ncbi:MAG TPA: hypothetical protein VMW69_11695, partial [Spirochaetia bacterium]|nr:hypothetical protein [Spirochaetia bacterium]